MRTAGSKIGLLIETVLVTFCKGLILGSQNEVTGTSDRDVTGGKWAYPIRLERTLLWFFHSEELGSSGERVSSDRVLEGFG